MTNVMSTEYAPAIWRPLQADHFIAGPCHKDRIILHITQGPSASSAFWTFWGSKSVIDGGTGRVSVQFCIDRDGTVYQYTPMRSWSWHASQVNQRSVGIEHAAMANGVLGITPAQLESSAALVAFLSKTLSIPLDRAHVQSHNEASPIDHHVLCCSPTLSPDDVVRKALTK